RALDELLRRAGTARSSRLAELGAPRAARLPARAGRFRTRAGDSCRRRYRRHEHSARRRSGHSRQSGRWRRQLRRGGKLVDRRNETHLSVMRKIVIGAVIVGVALAGVLYYRSSRSGSGTEATGPGAEGGVGFAGRRGGGGGDFPGGGRGGAGGGFRGGGGGFGGRGPMVVELAAARKATMN